MFGDGVIRTLRGKAYYGAHRRGEVGAQHPDSGEINFPIPSRSCRNTKIRIRFVLCFLSHIQKQIIQEKIKIHCFFNVR